MNQDLRLLFAVLAVAFACAAPVKAQVAQGGNYTLDQSAIASGGGQNSTGGGFTLDGTIGQPAAGTRSTNSPFAVAGGFWTANALAPTAASVSVGGRVLTMDGSGLRNARVTLTGIDGSARMVLTGKFGGFRFADVQFGETYIVSVASRRYIFQPQVVFVSEDLDDLNFIAVGQTGNIPPF